MPVEALAPVPGRSWTSALVACQARGLHHYLVRDWTQVVLTRSLCSTLLGVITKAKFKEEL